MLCCCVVNVVGVCNNKTTNWRLQAWGRCSCCGVVDAAETGSKECESVSVSNSSVASRFVMWGAQEQASGGCLFMSASDVRCYYVLQCTNAEILQDLAKVCRS